MDDTELKAATVEVYDESREKKWKGREMGRAR